MTVVTTLQAAHLLNKPGVRQHAPPRSSLPQPHSAVSAAAQHKLALVDEGCDGSAVPCQGLDALRLLHDACSAGEDRVLPWKLAPSTKLQASLQQCGCLWSGSLPASLQQSSQAQLQGSNMVTNNPTVSAPPATKHPTVMVLSPDPQVPALGHV